MNRRKFSLSLIALPLFTLASRGFAAPPASMKEIETMQKNWKALLADNASVAAAAATSAAVTPLFAAIFGLT